MQQKNRKKAVWMTLLTIFLLLIPILYFIYINLDALHQREAEKYHIALANLSVNRENTPPGETIQFSANASGGKGQLFFEFYYFDQEEKVIIQEKSSQNTASYQFPELGRYEVFASISDESPWTKDVAVSCWYGACHEGIDVSHHQGAIDWNQVRSSGYDFAMIRGGYGHESDKNDQTDRRFEENILGASNAGLKVGVYHFSYAMTP